MQMAKLQFLNFCVKFYHKIIVSNIFFVIFSISDLLFSFFIKYLIKAEHILFSIRNDLLYDALCLIVIYISC